MDERFRGPTDDPSFSDPGHNEPEGFDQMQDQAASMVDQAVDGDPIKLPSGDLLTYEDFGDGDGQFILNQSDVFANSYDEAQEKILDMLASLNEQKIKDLVKQKILENLGAGETNLAQRRLKGAAGAAQKKLENPAVDRAIGMATKRLQKAPAQQKVDFLLSMIQKMGVEPEELQGLMARLKGSNKKAMDAEEEIEEVYKNPDRRGAGGQDIDSGIGKSAHGNMGRDHNKKVAAARKKKTSARDAADKARLDRMASTGEGGWYKVGSKKKKKVKENELAEIKKGQDSIMNLNEQRNQKLNDELMKRLLK